MSDSSKAKIYWGGKTVHQNSDTYWNKYPLKPGEELCETDSGSFYNPLHSDEERWHTKRSGESSDEERQKKKKKRKHRSDEPSKRSRHSSKESSRRSRHSSNELSKRSKHTSAERSKRRRLNSEEHKKRIRHSSEDRSKRGKESSEERGRRSKYSSNDERPKKKERRKHEDKHEDKPKQNRSHRQEKPKKAKEEPKTIDTPKEVITEDQKKTVDLLTSKTGGAYIPPAKLRMMQASITDKASAAYQRIAWEALKKSLHGLINKASPQNICIIAREILRENIIRGRGLLCRSIIQAQAASPTFTNVFAALVAIINSKFPNIGELLLKRCIIRFKQGFRRNDKPTCLAAAIFIAHLVNQCVAHEIAALELLTLLLETPTNDSVEVAIAFLKECGQKLSIVCKRGLDDIFDLLRNILHEGSLEKRVQYMIEVMFQVRKDGFKDHPTIPEELDLVEEEDQFTHVLSLTEDKLEGQEILNVFKFDPEYEENEKKYENLKKELFGSDDESGEESGSEDESGSDDSDDSEAAEEKKQTIIDNTETNLVALRRTIYLTINSSLDFEECAHKLLKMELKPGQEIEMCNMFLDCCAEQRTYEKFYGLLAERFCRINQIYVAPFEKIFVDSYAIVHRFTTNKLRNVAKFFAHLLFTDAISWNVLSTIHLNEEETSSSSRIFIKILFQELSEFMSLAKLNDRIKDPTMHLAFEGLFPRDNPKNTRFAINFFTSIGLGGLTNELREHLKAQPKQSNVNKIMEALSASSSSSSSSTSDCDSDSSSSSSSSD
nr:PREDICTED: pre-mRNA-splicing factor CWC22 homolog [Bemisia tabaci]